MMDRLADLCGEGGAQLGEALVHGGAQAAQLGAQTLQLAPARPPRHHAVRLLPARPHYHDSMRPRE
jgi:hypothetical protein